MPTVTTAAALALILSVAMACATIVWFAHLRERRPRPRDVDAETWEVAVRKLETRLKAVESEWEDVYAKLVRFDRRRGGDKRQQVDQGQQIDLPSHTMTRTELLRRARQRRPDDVQNVHHS